jgi:hypothetical protein
MGFDKMKWLSRIIIAAGIALSPTSSMAVPQHFEAFQNTIGGLEAIDQRSYRHCHNMPVRTYCHKADSLPQNWPPFSDRKPEWKLDYQKRKGHVHSDECGHRVR